MEDHTPFKDAPKGDVTAEDKTHVRWFEGTGERKERGQTASHAAWEIRSTSVEMLQSLKALSDKAHFEV